MKNNNSKNLELVCKKCNSVRNISPLETLSKKTQKDFKEMQKHMPRIKIVYCKKCDEKAIVSEYTSF